MIRSRRLSDKAVSSSSSSSSMEEEANNREGVKCSQLEHMLSVEASLLNCADHRLLASSRHCPQSLAWKELVSQWYYDVSDHLEEPRDVPYVAMNLLERYIASGTVTSTELTPRTVEKKEFELAAITSLFLAVRVNGSSSLSIPDLLTMSRSPLDVKDIVSTGKEMLRTLSFDVKLFTPSDFLKAMISLHSDTNDPLSIEIVECASYMCEISVSDQFFVGLPASKIAFAALKAVLDLPSTRRKMDAASLKRFLKSLQLETRLNPKSSEISLISGRLHAIYSQSADDTVTDSNQPHLIEDDEEESNPNTIEFCAINTSESNGSIRALDDAASPARDAKRQRLL